MKALKTRVRTLNEPLSAASGDYGGSELGVQIYIL